MVRGPASTTCALYNRALNATELAVDMTRPVTCVSNPDAPALSVARRTSSFTAQQGGAVPAAKTLDVANAGGGTLNWTASDDAAG